MLVVQVDQEYRDANDDGLREVSIDQCFPLDEDEDFIPEPPTEGPQGDTEFEVGDRVIATPEGDSPDASNVGEVIRVIDSETIVLKFEDLPDTELTYKLNGDGVWEPFGDLAQADLPVTLHKEALNKAASELVRKALHEAEGPQGDTEFEVGDLVNLTTKMRGEPVELAGVVTMSNTPNDTSIRVKVEGSEVNLDYDRAAAAWAIDGDTLGIFDDSTDWIKVSRVQHK
jgi:hypothetical protein